MNITILSFTQKPPGLA